MGGYNSADETRFTKEDFTALHNCMLLAMEIGDKIGLDLHSKRNVHDWEFLDELHGSLKQIKERISSSAV